MCVHQIASTFLQLLCQLFILALKFPRMRLAAALVFVY